jgi:hypothetical protein
MRTSAAFILLIVVIASLSSLLVYHLISAPTSNSVLSNESIELRKYSGWKGVESMITPLDEYAKTVNEATISFSDLLWPYANSQNPFRDLVNRGIDVVIVTITSIKNIRHYSDIFVYVVYNARIDKIIVKPNNTIAIPPQAVCIKSPELCELARNQSRIIDNLISTIREGNTIELSVRAFIAKDSINKTNLTISDIASPFPLLEPGNQYLVFVRPELDGIHVYYDFVWGPWAYLIQDGKVYSLNYIKPSANISLDPTKLFKSPYIHWKPYPYEKLREIAIQKLSVNGESLEDFILKITRR